MEEDLFKIKKKSYVFQFLYGCHTSHWKSWFVLGQIKAFWKVYVWSSGFKQLKTKEIDISGYITNIYIQMNQSDWNKVILTSFHFPSWIFSSCRKLEYSRVWGRAERLSCWGGWKVTKQLFQNFFKNSQC